MNIEIPDLKCSIGIESYASNGSTIRRVNLKQAVPRLCRNSSHDLVLLLLDPKKNLKEFRRFTFQKENENYKLSTRFVHEGKATIQLPDLRCCIFISNCAPNDLSLFLKAFTLKCNYSSSSSVSKKQQRPEEKRSLISSMFTSPSRPMQMKVSNRLILEKISPLTTKDIIRNAERVKKDANNKTSELAISNRLTTSSSVSSPVASSKFQKRKLNSVLNDSTNCSPQSKRALTLSSTSSPIASSKFPKRKFDSVLREFTNCSPQSKRALILSMIPSPVRGLKLLASDTLTDEQRQVMNSVVNEGASCFFTGSAGTGKSYLLKFIIARLPPESTYITASTGISASQIKGITLHQFAGISSTWIDESAGKDAEIAGKEIAIKLEKDAGKVQRLKQCKTLIIDEISMISSEFFEILDHVTRAIRKRTEPFGGIQIVLCGDFLQLPPITAGKRSFAFQSNSWSQAIRHSFLLRQVKRQSDPTFISILQNLRLGRINEPIKKILIQTSKNNLRQNDFIPTQIFTHRRDVEMVNIRQLEKLTTEGVTYHPFDSNKFYTKMLDSICPTQNRLEIKVGSQVMLNRNIDISRGLVNGLVGRIVSFEAPDRNAKLCPRIKFINDVETIIQPEKWHLRLGANNNETFAFREHLPLQLAWAISVHKSQGMTISSGVEVSLSRVFESGQFYVALSRATSLDKIKILDFDPKNVFADPEALQFYKKLRFSN